MMNYKSFRRDIKTILYEYMIKDLFEPIMRCINGYKIYRYHCDSFDLRIYLDSNDNNVVSIKIYDFIVRIFLEKRKVIIGKYHLDDRIYWKKQNWYGNAKLSDFVIIYDYKYKKQSISC